MATPAAEVAPSLASVIALKIHEFTRRPVADQARLKSQLEALVALAIQPLPAADRIVLEMPDGAAVVVLGGAQAALEVAERSQAAAGDLPLCIGVNQGPVMPASDPLRGPGLIGDGLAAGVTLANAATPGHFLASRSFHDTLEADAPGRADELQRAGVFTDPQVRTHELFTLDRHAASARRRRLIAIGTFTVIGILGAGIAARLVLRTAEPLRPAAIEFDIKPRGDIHIDGVLKGRSPPLTRIELDPGPHTIEIRNNPHPPLRLEVDLGSAEEMTIAHSFAGPKAPAKGTSKKQDGADDFLRDLRRKWGF